jgi:hypothetical protein
MTGYRREVKSRARRPRILCAPRIEALELRIPLCADGGIDAVMAVGSPIPLASVGAFDTVQADPPTGGGTVQTGGAASGLPIPALSSRPGAHATIYLNFAGDTVASWTNWSNITIPSYATEGDNAPLTQTDVDSITGIWQIVAENYSPYDVNVTTVDPRTLKGYSGGVSQIDIGGNGSWTGGTYGGMSQVGGFIGSSPSSPARGFVFPDNLGMGAVWYTGEATSHESGHTFGLSHQSSYSGTTKSAEYQTGPGDGTAPIMGNSYYVSRGMWWYGQSSNGSTSYQNDMVTIASGGLNYRPLLTGGTTATAAPLAVSGTAVSASDVIDSMSQTDVWSFTTGAGSVSFTVAAPANGNLEPKLEVLDASGNVVAGWQDPAAGSVTWSGTLAAGTYYLAVGSHGVSSAATSTNYGFDVGSYSISGTVITPANYVSAPSGLTATAVSTSEIDLAWTGNDPGATSYLIARSSDGGATFSQIATLPSTATTYADVGLPSGTTYTYRVSAYNATTSGTSSPSNAATATTSPSVVVVSVPAAPSNLNAATVSGMGIKLTWTDNSTNETGFAIERASYNKNGRLGSWSQIATVGAGVTSYNDTSVNSRTSYDYRIRSYNSAGYSSYVYANQSKVLGSDQGKGGKGAAGGMVVDANELTVIVPASTTPGGGKAAHSHAGSSGAKTTAHDVAMDDLLATLIQQLLQRRRVANGWLLHHFVS